MQKSEAKPENTGSKTVCLRKEKPAVPVEERMPSQSSLCSRKRVPAVEHGMADIKVEAEVFNGMQTKKVLCNDPENKKEPIDAVRDD